MTLLLGVPWLVGSLAVVVLVADAVRPRNAALQWAAVAVCLGSGALTLLTRSESVIARVLFRFRRPTGQERQRLEPVWSVVTSAAGIDGSKFSLWIEESDDVNASATAGHTVAVTRRAVESLHPEQLAAVLAHDLLTAPRPGLVVNARAGALVGCA